MTSRDNFDFSGAGQGGGEESTSRSIGILYNAPPKTTTSTAKAAAAQPGHAHSWAPVQTGTGSSQYTPSPSQFPQAPIFTPQGGAAPPPSRPSGLYAKPQTLKLEDTNVAMIGTAEDKKARLDASNTEKAWEGAGKAPGLQVWRIEQFKVIPWPREQYGTFLDGDSFIVLSTYDKGNGVLGYDLHFWLGLNTSQDEAGTAAYKTVELDDHLHQAPVEHRQVQGHEDDLFLSYWKPALNVQSGGVASGFKHWTAPDYPKKLYSVEGAKAKNVRISEIQFTAQALNSGDVFVLDAGKEIWQFNGRESSVFEKSAGSSFVSKLKAERKTGAVNTHVTEQGDRDTATFLQLLGAPAGFQIPPALPPPPEARGLETKILSSPAHGAPQLIVSGFAANRSYLKTNGVFIVDQGEEVFVWVGKSSIAADAKFALQRGIDYLKTAGKPLWTPVHRVLEGTESQQFKALL